MDEQRTCYTCKSLKPLTEFVRRKGTPSGRGYQCSECNRKDMRQWRKDNPEKHRESVKAWRRSRPDKVAQYAKNWRKNNPEKALSNQFRDNHGITVEQYNSMLNAQNGCCAICKRNKFGKGRASKLWVDHCHTELRIRGLLCQRCNLGIGYFEDDPKLLQAAIAYLNQRQN